MTAELIDLGKRRSHWAVAKRTRNQIDVHAQLRRETWWPRFRKNVARLFGKDFWFLQRPSSVERLDQRFPREVRK
jgi:hypothetical protein